ncbi:MAG TPA: rhomboid family intramembrane serine protease [Solirubrobacterales bacterium]|nr:rhomboid family intramembrane serine protease [Solirubrobacterales bacterium]
MIPLKDTQDVKGPIWATVALIAVNFVLYVAGEIPHLNFWQAMLALIGLWLFGLYVERRLGSLIYLAIYVALAVSTGFLVGGVDQPAGSFAISLFLPVLALGLIHLALAPRSRILALVPIPFAMTFFEIPTVAMLVGWLALEVLLTAV